MANQYGIDMGNVLRTTEALKTSRQNRDLNSLRIKQHTEDKNNQNILVDARREAASGKPGAMAELLALSPEDGEKVMNITSKMDENAKKKKVHENGQIFLMGQYLLSGSENPELDYQKFKSQLAPEIVKQMPEQFDGNWVQRQMAMARDVNMILEHELDTQSTMQKQDFEAQQSKLDRESREKIATSKTATKGPAGTGKRTNTLFKLASSLSPEFSMDKDGNFKFATKEDYYNTLAITEMAEKLSNQGMGDAEAVAEAARALGIKIKNINIRGGGIDFSRVRARLNQSAQ